MRTRVLSVLALLVVGLLGMTACSGNMNLRWGGGNGQDDSSSADSKASPKVTDPAEEAESTEDDDTASRTDPEGCPSHVRLPDEIDPRVCTTPSESELVEASARWQTLVPETKGCAGACPSPTTGFGFTSPGGNLGCLISDASGRPELSCAAGNTGFMSDPAVFELSAPKPTRGVGAPLPEALQMISSRGAVVDATVLQFGQVARVGDEPQYCAMQYFGMTCWDTETGAGFLVSTDQWITWNRETTKSEGSCETCGKYHADGTPK